MKTEINSAALSKINWLALIVAGVNVAGTLGYIPPEHQSDVLVIVNTLGPALIVVARTWFTAPKAA